MSGATTVELNPGAGGAKSLHDLLAALNGGLPPTDAVVQLVKLAFGGAGAATMVSAADPLPVTGPLPPGAVTQIDGGSNGIRFGTCIAWALTTGAADSDTTAVAAGEIKVAIAYT